MDKNHYTSTEVIQMIIPISCKSLPRPQEEKVKRPSNNSTFKMCFYQIIIKDSKKHVNKSQTKSL